MNSCVRKFVCTQLCRSSGRIEKIWAVVKNKIGRKGGVKNIRELSTKLLESVKQVEKKTWLGSYAKTREWEDMMVERDDEFVDAGDENPLEQDELPSTGTVEDVQESSDEEGDEDEGEGACGEDA